jgi:hypothetical protein
MVTISKTQVDYLMHLLIKALAPIEYLYFIAHQVYVTLCIHVEILVNNEVRETESINRGVYEVSP